MDKNEGTGFYIMIIVAILAVVALVMMSMTSFRRDTPTGQATSFKSCMLGCIKVFTKYSCEAWQADGYTSQQQCSDTWANRCAEACISV